MIPCGQISKEKEKMTIEPSLHQSQELSYEIELTGQISQRWLDWFGNMTLLTLKKDERTCLSTVSIKVVDQAALLGVLQKLHNLGFSLVEVRLMNEAVGEKGSVG
jgi:hypothetical protein